MLCSPLICQASTNTFLAGIYKFIQQMQNGALIQRTRREGIEVAGNPNAEVLLPFKGGASSPLHGSLNRASASDV